MANIKDKLNNIKNALFGHEVRGSIHDGIEAINEEVENTTSRQNVLENTFEQLTINAGNSNAELVAARVEADGTTHKKLGDRLNKVDSQIKDNMNYVLNRPQSNLNLQRIGRKINYGENSSATNYNSNGSACMLQGGCKIDENTIAYMLWDSLNIELNKNKLVIMNTNTGIIIKEKDFTFGWCNSIDFKDGKIYIAERGNNQGNNGKIHIVEYDSLLHTETLILDKNVNAISIYENVLYVLEENTTKIYKYDLDGSCLNEVITLNIEQLYNQNILVTKDYIFLLSSKPSNLINVFDKDGNIVRSYNIPKYGGIYYIGEPQFIIKKEDNNMILGSVINYFNEFNNQFFKFNLVNNVVESLPINNYANTLYVDSDTDNFNPDGTNGNEFKTINECSNLNIRNIILEGNNKDYKYTYITDNKKFIRLLNCNFIEGLFGQYADLSFNTCNFSYSINNNDLSCLRLRDIKVNLNDCTFDSKNNEYCINTERNVDLKLIKPKFLNYNKDVINNAGSGNIINFNNYDNMPFIRHSNLKKYNLFSKGLIDNFKPGTYSYNTDLTSSEIQSILDNCTRIKIIYLPFNNSTKTIEFTRSSAQSYTFVDTNISTSSVLVRHCKTQITLTNTGYIIDSNKTTIFDGATWTQQDSTDNDTSYLFNTIRGIELLP